MLNERFTMLFTIREYQFTNGDRTINVIKETNSLDGTKIRKPILSKCFKLDWNLDDKTRKRRLKEYNKYIDVLYDKRVANEVLGTSRDKELLEFAKLKIEYANVFFRKEKNWVEEII